MAVIIIGGLGGCCQDQVGGGNGFTCGGHVLWACGPDVEACTTANKASDMGDGTAEVMSVDASSSTANHEMMAMSFMTAAGVVSGALLLL